MPDGVATTTSTSTSGAGAGGGSSAPAPGVVSRRIAPFAPLAIALLAQGAVLSTGPTKSSADVAAICDADIAGYEECHSEYLNGCSPSGKYDAYLNLIKNQLVPPTSPPLRYLTGDDIGKLEQGLPQDLSRTNHETYKDDLAGLGEGRVFGLVGYLYYAKNGGKESSNCELSQPTDVDFHIGIGFVPADQHTQRTKSSMIVEMTPHWRAQFEPNWDVPMLKTAVDHQVRLVGQLLVDNEHFDPKDDCAFAGAGAGCWRASVWELHPVTRFEVCRSGTCTETSGDWVSLEELANPAGSQSSGDAAPAPAAGRSTPAPPAR